MFLDSWIAGRISHEAQSLRRKVRRFFLRGGDHGRTGVDEGAVDEGAVDCVVDGMAAVDVEVVRGAVSNCAWGAASAAEVEDTARPAGAVPPTIASLFTSVLESHQPPTPTMNNPSAEATTMGSM